MNDDPTLPPALETRGQGEDARLFSPSAARNREPLTRIMHGVLPPQARVLEVGAGTGEHAVSFVHARPDIFWTPGDPDPQSRASIWAWTQHFNLQDRIAAPLALDATSADWGVAPQPAFDALVSINMIHIAPWAATLGLLDGAARHLRAGGLMLLYGPFMRGGAHTAPSNAEFDVSLRARNLDWGVRALEDVEAQAQTRGLTLQTVLEMPANNLVVVFENGPAA